MKRAPCAEDALGPVLAIEMAAALAVPGRTKRSAARLAIVQAIRKGTLRPGDRLPPENRLGSILGISLGTVQAALRQLQQADVIIRRRGDGSRVAAGEPLARDIWHFRFAAKPGGQPLRLLTEKVWIDTLHEPGDWCDFLGKRPSYLRIRRRVRMQNQAVVGAEMFLATDLAPGIAALQPSNLGMVNIRPYLEERFGIRTASAEHAVQTTALAPATAVIFGLEPGAQMFEIHARARSATHQPVYFQRILVPTASFVLTF